MSTLILMCAGSSARYPGDRPKWSLTHPSGNIMAAEAIRSLTGFTRVVAAFNTADADHFGVDAIRAELSQVQTWASVDTHVAVIGKPRGHARDVATVLRMADVVGPFTAKDCDNTFAVTTEPRGNWVAVSSLMGVGRVDPANKSYVACHGGVGAIARIEERVCLSEWFCCGAYGFASPELYFAYLSDVDAHVSQVISRAICAGEQFTAERASEYADWGTAEDWQRYRSTFRTLFVDVDGVLVQGSHRSFHPQWGATNLMSRNVAYLNEMHATGRCEIILTTSRPESMREKTIAQLSGVAFDRLVMGLRSCSRVVVNDYIAVRGERTAFAVQLERDNDGLREAMRREPTA